MPPTLQRNAPYKSKVTKLSISAIGPNVSQYYAEIMSGQTDLEQEQHRAARPKVDSSLAIWREPDRRGWEWYYLFSFCHAEQRTLHCPKVRFVCRVEPRWRIHRHGRHDLEGQVG